MKDLLSAFILYKHLIFSFKKVVNIKMSIIILKIKTFLFLKAKYRSK